MGLTVVAEIWSDYGGIEDDVRWKDTGLLTGSIHRLERGEPVHERPMVRELARLLVRLASAPEPAVNPQGVAALQES